MGLEAFMLQCSKRSGIRKAFVCGRLPSFYHSTAAPSGGLRQADSEGFQRGANQYAAYLETPEGRLRSDLAFANLQDFLPLQAKLALCST
jgi:hypothetical protein